MITKPSFIIEADWQLLKQKYKNERQLKNAVNKLENGYPIQYLIGYVDFYKVKILVNSNVLVPRFETELLVDKLIKYMNEYNLKKENIIDLCTGSGCIAVSLKKVFENSSVVGVDKSFKALQVAKKNAKINETEINFKRKDILKDFSFHEHFAVLVSNPPYVTLNEEVSKETHYEPKEALYPGNNDIVFYERILKESKNVLCKKNIIAFEIGCEQSERICKVAKTIYPEAKIKVEKDYNDYDRFIFIFNNCE